jgi:predicted DNA-binding transcriptional regulator YafY
MARKRTTSPARQPPSASAARGGLTAERIVRLYQLVQLLSVPQTRGTLTRRLRVDVRGFYRDLESLRLAGVEVLLDKGRYRLGETADNATARLPFPDPQLTCGEARALAKGRTAAHRRLREQIEHLTR